MPYSIYAEDALGSKEKHPQKCDLVLGSVVAVEFKYRNSINTKEVEEVKNDLLKLEKYIGGQKADWGIFLMIDQTNRYGQRIQPFVEEKASADHIGWKAIKGFDTLIVVLRPEKEI